MKKSIKHFAVVTMVVAVATMGMFMTGCRNRNNYDFTIGLNQFLVFPAACDSTEGFRTRLTELMDDAGYSVNFLYQNANGDAATATTIANNFLAQRVDMMFSVGTTAVNATIAAAAGAGGTTPVVFSSASNPTASQMLHPFTTGTSDVVDMTAQVALLRELVGIPTGGFYVAYLYSSDEDNVRAQGDMLVDAAAADGITVTRHGVTDVGQVTTRITAIQGNPRYRAIFTGQDNRLGTDAAFQMIGDLNANGSRPLPIMSSFAAKVAAGAAVLSMAPCYLHLGAMTAELAFRVLVGGETPGDIRINGMRYYRSPATALDLIINRTLAESFGMTIPQRMLDAATEVY
ncbi:MAG: hypothetical protein FWE38_03565 [Firmicutes bacterium]|nr:hypothetical protein [Bacillota bacterium]